VRKAWALPEPDSQTTVLSNNPSSCSQTVEPTRHVEKPSANVSKNSNRNIAAASSHKTDTPADSTESSDESSKYTLSDEDDDDDDKRPLPPAKGKAPRVDPFTDWDNGEPLTPEERMSVMALKSNYERAKVMNKRRNDRILQELDMKEAAAKVLDGKKGKGKACKGKGSKAQSVVQIVPEKPKRWVLIAGPRSPALTPTTGQ
jgi:hypothetical protein